jgi:hypothetical protein
MSVNRGADGGSDPIRHYRRSTSRPRSRVQFDAGKSCLLDGRRVLDVPVIVTAADPAKIVRKRLAFGGLQRRPQAVG